MAHAPMTLFRVIVCALALLPAAAGDFCATKFEQYGDFAFEAASLLNVTFFDEGGYAVVDVAMVPSDGYIAGYAAEKYVISSCTNLPGLEALVPGATEYITVASKISVKTTTVVALVDKIDAVDLLVAYDDIQWTSSQTVIDHVLKFSIPLTHVQYPGSGIIDTVLLTQGSELHITDHYNCVDDRAGLVNTTIPVVCIPNSLETTPLGKAEWMKLIGLLLIGKGGKSITEFSGISSYYSAAKLFATSKTPKTVIQGDYSFPFWWNGNTGGWSMSWLNSYIASHFTNGGGVYVAPSTYSPNTYIDLPGAKETWAKAEFWIASDALTTLASTDSDVAWIKNMPAVKCGNVYQWTARVNPNGGNDMYESADVSPDVVLKDIIKILNPELLTSHTLYYAQKIDVSAYEGICPYDTPETTTPTSSSTTTTTTTTKSTNGTNAGAANAATGLTGLNLGLTIAVAILGSVLIVVALGTSLMFQRRARAANTINDALKVGTFSA